MHGDKVVGVFVRSHALLLAFADGLKRRLTRFRN
jgi:hypothetical protein